MSAALSSDFDDLRDLYQRTLMERARAPRHAMRLDVFDATARADNAACGDRCTVFVRREPGRVAELGFEARGCAISIASADLMAELVPGRSRDEIRALAAGLRGMVAGGPVIEPALAPLSGIAEYPSRKACATLAWDALAAALEDQR